MVENRTTACKWDTVIPFAPLWEAYRRLVKPNGAVILFGQEPFSSRLRLSNEGWYKYDWVWDKCSPSGFLNAKKMPLRVHENILVFYGRQPTYNPQKHKKTRNDARSGAHSRLESEKTDTGVYGEFQRIISGVRSADSHPKTILNFARGNGLGQHRQQHPTQKPVALLEYLIKTYTNPGETVLDSCFGSGSTAIACIRTDRKFIGIEKDPHYFQVACQRIKDEQRQEGLFTI